MQLDILVLISEWHQKFQCNNAAFQIDQPDIVLVLNTMHSSKFQMLIYRTDITYQMFCPWTMHFLPLIRSWTIYDS